MKLSFDIKKLLKAKGAGFVLLGVTAGMLLLLMPQKDSKTQDIEPKILFTSQEYCSQLEQKTETLIKDLPDVKDCTVFITLEKGYSYIYATDQHVNQQGDSKETDKTVVLAADGNGESPILIQETMPKVAGVAVVCPRADYQTQYKIVELICALYNIPSNRISVQT